LYFIQHDLITNHGWAHIESNELWQGHGTISDKLRRKFGTIPDTILFWETYELLVKYARDIQRLNSRKVFFADDLHWWNRRMREMKVLTFAVSDLILSTYAYCWTRLYPELSYKQVTWIPHSASPDFILPLNPNPRNAIFLSGAINEVYPLRQKMRQLHVDSAYPIEYHRHPGYYCGYDYERNASVGRGYAERIQNCRVGFADSVFPYAYVVAKFFEIPATGALLLADDAVSPHLRQLGFEANRDYIPVSQKNLHQQIELVLDERNHKELDQIRSRAQTLVHESHKTSDRAQLINEACSA